MDQVIRGLVSEGMASHCNPPKDLRREIWEDPETLARRYTADQVENLMRDSGSNRPDLIHALGWHMVPTISRRGDNPDAVHRLLLAPYSLFSLYTAALGRDRPELRIDPCLQERS